MIESFDAYQQNLDNSHRRSAANQKTRPQKKEQNLRHRLSDQKWRQNLSKGFAALKTIVKQNRKEAVEQLMTSEGTKGLLLNEMPAMANKRLSRIETLKSTINLIETKESVIENFINERQQHLIDMSVKNESPNSGKQLMAANGLQKIKDMFGIFEKRHEMEGKDNSFKAKIAENYGINDKKETSVEDNQCLSTTYAKTADPLISAIEETKPEVFGEEINSIIGYKTTFGFKSEGVTEEWPPSTTTKTTCDSGVDINNNDTNYGYLRGAKEYDLSLDSIHECIPFFESLSSLDNKSFADFCYGLDPKDYLTTDLTEHLAITMPLTSFGSSLTYFNDSYV